MNLPENSFENKRRYQRASIELPLNYRNLRKTGESPLGSITRNLSEGGVCFKSNEFISLACRMVVEITLPTAQKPIKAITKVAWIKRLPVADQYELGNQFLEMTKEDKMAINNFVTSVSQPPQGQPSGSSQSAV